jgi:hypothetical protein
MTTTIIWGAVLWVIVAVVAWGTTVTSRVPMTPARRQSAQRRWSR